MIRQVKTPEKSYKFSKFSDIVFKNRGLAEEGASTHFPPPTDFIHDRVFNPYDQDEEVHEWENESRFKQYDKESEYWNYNDEFDHHQNIHSSAFFSFLGSKMLLTNFTIFGFIIFSFER